MEKTQHNLQLDLKEKESELEDLGCWRGLLSKVIIKNIAKDSHRTHSFQRKKPIKQLTTTRKEAWKKTKHKFFDNLLKQKSL